MQLKAMFGVPTESSMALQNFGRDHLMCIL